MLVALEVSWLKSSVVHLPHTLAVKGGYCLDAISTSATAVARILVGEAPPELPSMVASDVATETVYQVAVEQSKYWRCMNPKAVEPQEGMSALPCIDLSLHNVHRIAGISGLNTRSEHPRFDGSSVV